MKAHHTMGISILFALLVPLWPLFLHAQTKTAQDICDTQSETANNTVTNDCIACITVVENGKQIKKPVGASCTVTGGGASTKAACVPNASVLPRNCETKYCLGGKCFYADQAKQPQSGTGTTAEAQRNELQQQGTNVTPLELDPKATRLEQLSSVLESPDPAMPATEYRSNLNEYNSLLEELTGAPINDPSPAATEARQDALQNIFFGGNDSQLVPPQPTDDVGATDEIETPGTQSSNTFGDSSDPDLFLYDESNDTKSTAPEACTSWYCPITESAKAAGKWAVDTSGKMEDWLKGKVSEIQEKGLGFFNPIGSLEAKPAPVDIKNLGGLDTTCYGGTSGCQIGDAYPMEGRPTASGLPYKSEDPTVATKDRNVPFGTVYYVEDPKTGKGLFVAKTDHTGTRDPSQMDLSASAMEKGLGYDGGRRDLQFTEVYRPESGTNQDKATNGVALAKALNERLAAGDTPTQATFSLASLPPSGGVGTRSDTGTSVGTESVAFAGDFDVPRWTATDLNKHVTSFGLENGKTYGDCQGCTALPNDLNVPDSVLRSTDGAGNVRDRAIAYDGQTLENLVKANEIHKDRFGTDLNVSSGYRPPEVNENTPNAAKNSPHVDYLAVDVRCSSASHCNEVYRIMAASGFERVAYGPGHIHADNRTTPWNSLQEPLAMVDVTGKAQIAAFKGGERFESYAFGTAPPAIVAAIPLPPDRPLTDGAEYDVPNWNHIVTLERPLISQTDTQGLADSILADYRGSIAEPSASFNLASAPPDNSQASESAFTGDFGAAPPLTRGEMIALGVVPEPSGGEISTDWYGGLFSESKSQDAALALNTSDYDKIAFLDENVGPGVGDLYTQVLEQQQAALRPGQTDADSFASRFVFNTNQGDSPSASFQLSSLPDNDSSGIDTSVWDSEDVERGQEIRNTGLWGRLEEFQDQIRTEAQRLQLFSFRDPDTYNTVYDSDITDSPASVMTDFGLEDSTQVAPLDTQRPSGVILGQEELLVPQQTQSDVPSEAVPLPQSRPVIAGSDEFAPPYVYNPPGRGPDDADSVPLDYTPLEPIYTGDTTPILNPLLPQERPVLPSDYASGYDASDTYVDWGKLTFSDAFGSDPLAVGDFPEGATDVSYDIAGVPGGLPNEVPPTEGIVFGPAEPLIPEPVDSVPLPRSRPVIAGSDEFAPPYVYNPPGRGPDDADSVPQIDQQRFDTVFLGDDRIAVEQEQERLDTVFSGDDRIATEQSQERSDVVYLADIDGLPTDEDINEIVEAGTTRDTFSPPAAGSTEDGPDTSDVADARMTTEEVEALKRQTETELAAARGKIKEAQTEQRRMEIERDRRLAAAGVHTLEEAIAKRGATKEDERRMGAGLAAAKRLKQVALAEGNVSLARQLDAYIKTASELQQNPLNAFSVQAEGKRLIELQSVKQLGGGDTALNNMRYADLRRAISGFSTERKTLTASINSLQDAVGEQTSYIALLNAPQDAIFTGNAVNDADVWSNVTYEPDPYALYAVHPDSGIGFADIDPLDYGLYAGNPDEQGTFVFDEPAGPVVPFVLASAPDAPSVPQLNLPDDITSAEYFGTDSGVVSRIDLPEDISSLEGFETDSGVLPTIPPSGVIIGSASCSGRSFCGDGSSLEGDIMANGERFDSNKLTAAVPPSSPYSLGDRVLVKNTATEQSVEVTVTDRISESAGRPVNLSYAAMDAIGGSGLAEVEISRADAPTTQPTTPTLAALPVAVPPVGNATSPYQVWGSSIPSVAVRRELYNQLATEGYVPSVSQYSGTWMQNDSLIKGLRDRQSCELYGTSCR